MDKQKIYIVSWYGTNLIGGVERVTQDMRLCWKEQYDVEIIDFRKMKEKLIYKLLLEKHFILDAILVSLFTNHKIRKIRNKVKVVVQGYNAPFVKADVMMAHGTMRGYKIAMEGSKAKWHFSQLFEKISAKRAHKVIAVGRHVRDELIQLYSIEEKKIQVIENCVDTHMFFPKEKKRNDKYTNIIFSGRLEYSKGLNKLLELAEYIENVEGIRLVIATNTKENIELFSRFVNTEINSELSKEEMNDFYNEGDVMFFPSLYEGFGLVTIEALAAGVPVMGNMIGAVNDLYICGQSGVGIISNDMSENLAQMLKFANEYKSFESKKVLHQCMVSSYSFNMYKDKMEKLWV